MEKRVRRMTMPALGVAALAILGATALPARAEPGSETENSVAIPSETPVLASARLEKLDPAPQDAPVPPKPKAPKPKAETPKGKPRANKISVGGLIDFYYQHQFSGATNGQTLTGRIYDIRHDTPALSLAWVDIQKKADPGQVGFLLSLAVGDSADNDVAPNPAGKGSSYGEARYKNIAQGIVTYVAKNGLIFDFGKFLSPYGYDTTKVILNPNYSLTDATFLVPNYETGFRISYPIRRLVLSFYLVNSIYHTATSGVQEDNARPDYIFRANYTTPGGKFNYIFAAGYGSDRLGANRGNEGVALVDNWLTWSLTPKITLAGEYVYRKDSDGGGQYALTGHGYGVYYRQQLTPKYAFVIRSSGFQKSTLPFGGARTIVRADEITATLEDKVTARLTARLEYRHDNSSNPAAFGYVKGNSAGPSGYQDTLTLAGLYTF